MSGADRLMGVHIGARWAPGFVERRDTQAGTFEAINSPIATAAELEVQRALLRPIRHAWIARRITQAQQAQHVQRKGQDEHRNTRAV